MQGNNEEFLIYTEKKILKRLVLLAEYKKVKFYGFN